MHKFLLGNPLILFLILSMESWNQVVNFILKAINSRGTPNRNGELTATEKGKVGDDQPSKWIAAKESNTTRFTPRDIVVHTSANVSADSDTTAIALHAISYNLVRNTSTIDKLITEIDQAQGEGKLGAPGIHSPFVPTYKP